MAKNIKKKKSKDRYSVDNLVTEFLEYFRARGHEVVPSAPLLPEDPTLLFTAAGMVPFKAYYSNPDKAPYPRAASVQKCLRAGGKQSDLENVGRTLRHHTFFEMLGNFSFGDYFKKEAVEYGWELSVDVWKLDTAQLWISVYEDDDEAFDLWHQHIGVPKERIVRLGKGDNFWGPVGETGVCGPSSEMYFDTGAERGCGRNDCAPGCDCDRYIEYWNHVFPQFFYTESGVYDPLPKPGIDTGLGLERLAFILQGAGDNFHTDEFVRIRNAVARALPAGTSAEDAGLALNVASDHVRALTFALAEGIMPSNEGRGYVLRRLLRRALTKMHPFGVRDPFLAGAVDVVVDVMGGRYPEIRPQAALAKKVITAEEERFLATLEQGLGRLHTVLEDALGKKAKTLSGEEVFQLYDTYGFPPELTRELAEERGLDIDRAGFEAEMAKQKDRARKSSFHAVGHAGGDDFVVVAETGPSEFIGYDQLECDARVAGVRPHADDENVVEFTTDRTVFYPEGGGQVGDTGTASFGGQTFEVVDTYRVGDRIAHLARWNSSEDAAEWFRENAEGRLSVDREARYDTMRNHTATHALHAALRRVLGEHVAQAGSLVEPERLRFDFHHFNAMTREEIAEVEHIVNEVVMDDRAVKSEFMSYDRALEAGAMALFGEKYGDEVRVVSIEDFSRELCGGTHLRRTGEIGPFVVRQETAVAAGVRRVEALTGRGALGYVKSLERELSTIAGLLKVAPADVERRLRALLDETEELQKRQRKAEQQRAKDQAGEALSRGTDIAGVTYVSARVSAPDVPGLRKYGDELRGKLGLGLAVLCQDKAEKPVCLVVASDRLIQERSVKATDITARVAEALSHRGGGKPHMAQFGIPNGNEFNKVAEFVKVTLEELLQSP